MENIWVIRAGKDTKNFNFYKKENFVAVGEDIGDIKNLSLDEMKFRLKGKANNVNTSAGIIRRFRDEVKIGDYFICTSPNSEYLLLGEIMGDVEYNPDLSLRYEYTCYRRPVKWISKIYRNVLSDAARRGISPQTTVFKVNPKWQKEIFKNQLSLDFTPNTTIKTDRLRESEKFYIKAKLKEEGMELEDTNYKKAIMFYEKLLSNELFSNDYYPYRRLVILCDKTKNYRKQYNVIKSFFYSNIYCNNHQFLWFRNKLYRLIKLDFTDENEINEILEYFNENGLNNKEKSNIPEVIAERININGDVPEKMSFDRYDWYQSTYELKEKAIGYKLQGNYQKAIETYEDMIYNKGYYSYKYYDKLYFLYRDIGDYQNAERIINEYYGGNSTNSEYSEKKFEDHKKELKRLKEGKSEPKKSNLIISFPDEEQVSDNISNDSNAFIVSTLNDDAKENIPYYDIPEEDYFDELNLSSEFEKYDYYKKYSLNVELNEKYVADIKQPLIFYQYDKNLSLEDNLQRKYYLKRYAIKLYFNRRYDDYIELLEKLKKNNFFKNDWYPYRRLSIIYMRLDRYEEALKNLKELFYNDIWLNEYHYIYFINAFKRLEKHIYFDEKDVLDCLDYYNVNGALNESKSDNPIVLADKIKFNRINSMIMVLSNEGFDDEQFEFELQEKGFLFENDEDYETAISYYINLIDEGFTKFEIYERIVYCLDILDQYELMFDILKHLVNTNGKQIIYKNKKWANKYLKLINSNLGTDYAIKDL